jgi:hypothetical protein
MKKISTKVYRLFSDKRKNHDIGMLVILTSPRGGPYRARWIDKEQKIHSDGFPNTHSGSKIIGDRVPFSYIHRRCRPENNTMMYAGLPAYEEALRQLGVYDVEDSEGFHDESPLKIGATYNPDAGEVETL